MIDPLTGDFLFSTFGGGDRIVRVDGFVAPPQPNPNPTPRISEPGALALFGLGLIGMGYISRRKRKAS